MGAIPCGCNTNGTHYYYHIQTDREEKKIMRKEFIKVRDVRKERKR